MKAHRTLFTRLLAIGVRGDRQQRQPQPQQQQLHTHTPLSAGDVSPLQGHDQLLVRVGSTLGWCRSLWTAGSTQLKKARRNTKSALWDWTRELRSPAGMGRCSLRVPTAPINGAASSADAGPAFPQEDPDRQRKTPATENYRISCIMRWKDLGDGRSSITLMCKLTVIVAISKFYLFNFFFCGTRR